MSDDRIQNHFGVLLKDQLQKKSMSMRDLSELTGIDTATISRIINGKRKANLQHLEKIADSLEIPLLELVNASSDSVDQGMGSNSNAMNLFDSIDSFLTSSNVYDNDFSSELVEAELNKYEKYVQTEEGKQLISNSFMTKLQKVDSIGPFIERLKDFYETYRLGKADQSDLLLIGSVLAYFIMPIDVIPDYIFPIGYLDDAVAANIVADKLQKKGKENSQ